jgi:hypothetical protein
MIWCLELSVAKWLAHLPFTFKAASSIQIKFKSLYDQNFPTRKINHKKLPRKPWISKGLLKSIKRKNKLYNIFMHKKTDTSKQKFKSYRNKLNHLLKIAKRHHYCCKFDLARNDLKQTWTILKSLINRTKTMSKFPDIFKNNQTVISDPQLIADSFNSYFTNIGANLADQIVRTPATYHHYLKGL